MSKRKLKAIGYEKDFIDFEDDNAYRAFVCDIESRYLKTKDEAWVKDVLSKEKSEEWLQIFKEYFAERGFTTFTTRAAAVDHLLNCVVEKIFNENDKAQELTSDKYLKSIESNMEANESSTEFTELVEDLCKMFKITSHPDPMVSLEAACIYIKKYLNPAFIKRHNTEVKEGKIKSFELKSFPSGLPNFPDPIMAISARIFRLLNIETIRDTQTAVNEILTAIQNITAEKN